MQRKHQKGEDSSSDNDSLDDIVMYGTGLEARRSREAIGDFKRENSEVARFVESQYPNATKPELLSVAFMIVSLAGKRSHPLPEGLAITRLMCRSYLLILKWFDDNWEYVKDLVLNIKLVDRSFQIISK
jgi:hypothetical protein